MRASMGSYRKLLAAAVVTIAAAVAGCTAPTPSISGVGTTLYDVPPSELGLLVGSFGPLKSERRFSGHSLMIRHLPSGQSAVFQFQGSGLLRFMDFPADFDKSDSHGAIFTMKLPAGRYEVYNVGLFQSGGFGGWQTLSQPFSVPFAIEGGKVTYVGEYIIRRVPGANTSAVQGLGASTGVYLEFDDQQARDLAFARKKWPEFAEAPVVSGMPDLKVPHPVVVRYNAPPPPGVRGP